MFKNLKFKYKIILMPALATGAFLLILFATQFFSGRNEKLLTQIETGYAPALELSRDLEEILGAIQRGLQDAVAAVDEDMLLTTDTYRDRFFKRLEEGREITTLSAEYLDNLKTIFQAYYTFARETSQRMIGGEAGEQMVSALELMTNHYNEMKEKLELNTRQDKENMAAAFVSTRGNNRTSTLIMTVSILSCMILLGGLSVFLTRSITKPLGIAVSVARQLAQGDLTVAFEASSKDETGQLLLAMKEMTAYIQKVAEVAQKIAIGNIQVQVTPRSDRDILNHAFARTIAYIQEVADIAEKISEQNLRVAVNPKSDRDVLSQSLKKMVTHLQGIMKRLTESSDRIASTAEQLSTASQQISQGSQEQASATTETSASIEQMEASITQVASNADSLASNANETSMYIQQVTPSVQSVAHNTADLLAFANETSSTIQQMATSIEQVALNAREAGKSSELAFKEAQEGGIAVKKTVEGMQRISDTMKEIANVIQKFEESSQEINSIVDVIDEIAELTSLLALNAAIQAAQAGEHGRGFAVVASEVKTLAERSALSVKEIAQRISNVQKDTTKAIQAVEQGSQKVHEGVTLTTQAGETLDKIVQTIGAVSRRMLEISEATNNQARASEHVVRTVETMRDRIQQVSSATNEQAITSRQIMEAVDRMNRMIDEVSMGTRQQKLAAGQVLKAIVNITRISEQNGMIASEIEVVTKDLNKQADGLHKVMGSFKVDLS
jgi:methyl-accepting chemotaxis protein